MDSGKVNEVIFSATEDYRIYKIKVKMLKYNKNQ